jgi:hypothetical protein
MRPCALLRTSTLAFLLVGCLVASGCANKRAGGGMQTLADPPSPEPEMRAIFVATAYNIDWPSRPSLHRSVLEDEIRATVARAKALNCNTILLQIRAFGDRIQRDTTLAVDSKDDFKLTDEPWAQALNWGHDPDTGPAPKTFDPLKVWVEACDEHGIELHAWINPFRIHSLVKVKVRGTEYILPVVKHNKQLYLNPKSMAVQKYVRAVIEDLLKNYPISSAYSAADVEPGEAVLAAAQPGPIAALSSDGGPDGVVFDHQLPDEGGATTSPIGGPGGRAAPVGDAVLASSVTPPPPPPPTTKSFAERRVDDLVAIANAANKTNPIPGYSMNGTIGGFLDAVFTQVKERVQFGLSPDADDAAVMKRLNDNKVDYVIPELYDDATFESQLQDWLDNIPNVSDPPKVVAGLNTVRIQTPPDAEDDPVPAQTIQQHIDLARNTVGPTSGKGASGQAHFGASALRLKEQSGPHKDNIGEKLKGKEYQVARRSMPMRRANGALPGKPNVSIQTVGGQRIAVWSGTGRKARRWEVWFMDNGTWVPQRAFGRKETQVALPTSVSEVQVRGFDKYNRPGPWGKAP